MLRYFILKRIMTVTALVALVVFSSLPAFAQEKTPAVAGAAAISANDSLALASNDSLALAAGIKALVKKEQSGLWNRMKSSGIGVLYAKGGIFMHPLLLSSIIGLMFIIERLWTLSRARTNVKDLMTRVIKALREGGIEASLHECEKTRGPIAAVLHSGLMRASRGPEAVEKAISTAGVIEMSFLERGLIAIATVANIAPLLGFLGTVSGMINAFGAIAAAEQVSAKLVAKGIEEALITTLAGLCIAIPANVMHNFFISQIDRFIIEMEEASAELVDELLEAEYRA